MSIWEYIISIRLNKKQKIIAAVIAAVLVVGIATTVILLTTSDKEKKPTTGDTNIEKSDSEETDKDSTEESVPDEIPEPDAEDPLVSMSENTQREEGATVDIEDIVVNKQDAVAHGIDVSKYQGKINWEKVANAGIDFAMVRVGYRTSVSGQITEDNYAKYNMQQANKYGIKVGAYFFSTAISVAEAQEEANWVAEYIADYSITYPVAYDCEGFEESGNRHYGVDEGLRTDIALAFMGRIAERGYTPLFYSSKNHMEDEYVWDMTRISSIYSVWVAQYPAKPYPDTAYASYSGAHVMWQYTNKGNVPGISTSVDMNVSYFGYENSVGPSTSPEDSDTPDEQAPAFNMTFTDVNEQVTAKDETNLRDIPSQGTDSKVMYTLKNGEVVTRTGVSNSGWSRVVYNGNTYYAVSSLLTTDLTYAPPQEEEDDGIKTQFTEVNEQVTAKIEVNLRAKPSTDDTIASVVAKIANGEVVTRTGINTEVGWSRVVYNGQTLYCVSSYLELVE